KLYFAPWKPTFRFDFRPLKDMFGFGSKLILTNIFTQISNNIFSVVLGKFYNPSQVGFYTQGQKWMGMGHQLIGGMINGVAQPVLVEVMDDKERQALVFRKMVRFGAFISFPAMLGLAFVAKEFVWILLGEKWLDSVPFLQLFCIWGAIEYLRLLYTNLLVSHGKSDIYLYGMVLIGLLQLLIVGVMFPFGIYSMVIGYVCTYYIGLLYWHCFVKNILSINVFDIIIDILPYIGAIFVSFFIANLLILHIENLYISFLLKFVISAIVYCLIMWYGDSIIFKEVLSYFKNGLNRILTYNR
ncbi:oligosaccharide flippase family protein, partial [uncultured Parabacteroides sp.]|uniref:oligosaccharide flippase family protein n=1 Tax=uncultured Parabacteroides sp. TaxID=512312 RepID=UPI00261830CA